MFKPGFNWSASRGLPEKGDWGQKRGLLIRVAGGAATGIFTPASFFGLNLTLFFRTVLQKSVNNSLKIPVSTESIRKATKCRSDHSCLRGGHDCVCSVETSIANFGLFVKPAEHCTCSYKMSFGNGFICLCPVRYEIFMRSRSGQISWYGLYQTGSARL
jgi:hypothetical protein